MIYKQNIKHFFKFYQYFPILRYRYYLVLSLPILLLILNFFHLIIILLFCSYANIRNIYLHTVVHYTFFIILYDCVSFLVLFLVHCLQFLKYWFLLKFSGTEKGCWYELLNWIIVVWQIDHLWLFKLLIRWVKVWVIIWILSKIEKSEY